MSDAAPLPTTRECPFDPPAELRRMAVRSVSRLRYPDGSDGWLVSDHATAREVLSDARFSARGDLIRSPIRPTPQGDIAPPGAFIFMDPPDHTRYRKLLTGQFTLRRMRTLEPGIAKTTEKVLDGMARVGPPVDLMRTFALPIASQVICELLGVPYADHETFESQSLDMADPAKSDEERDAAGAAMFMYLYEVVRTKRTAPANDLLSGLIIESDLSDDELTGIAVMLLFAGHETTANMLGLGTFALLRHPEQLGALRADLGLVEGAVEELLRHLSVVQYEVNRTALADVELAGQLIRVGESVLVSLPLANRDPQRFDRPDELDVTRSASGHLAFGHGVHQCIGSQLARIEMRVGFTALLRRFPKLNLAMPAEDVPLRSGRGIYGVERLLVSW